MNKHTLFAAVLMSIFLYGCDGCKKKPHNYAVDSDLKAAFDFQPGTYWIYQDSIGGSIDSFVVSTNEFAPAQSFSNFSGDEYNISINDYKLGPIFGDDSTYWMMRLTYNTIDLLLNSFIDSNQAVVSFNPLVTYPFVTGNVSSISDVPASDTGTVTQIFPTYSLDGQSYNNVAEVYQKLPIAIGKLANNWFYINKDVGIIKMRVNYQVDSLYRVWELQRCKIIR